MMRMQAVSPFFIVRDVANMVAFYRDRLGFETTCEEAQHDPFFAIIRREGRQLKSEQGLPIPMRSPPNFSAAVRSSPPRVATPMTAFADSRSRIPTVVSCSSAGGASW